MIPYRKLFETHFATKVFPNQEYFEVFKNPTETEYRQCKVFPDRQIRGVVVEKDLYISYNGCIREDGKDSLRDIMHRDILKVLDEQEILFSGGSPRFLEHLKEYFCCDILANGKIFPSADYGSSERSEIAEYLEIVKEKLYFLKSYNIGKPITDWENSKGIDR